MQLVKNTLAIEIGEWDDPGDYPSAAGSAPLSSYEYVESIGGEVAFTLDAEEIASYKEHPADFINGILSDGAIKLPSPVKSCKFDSKLEGAILTLTPTAEFEADTIERDYCEDDYL